MILHNFIKIQIYHHNQCIIEIFIKIKKETRNLKYLIKRVDEFKITMYIIILFSCKKKIEKTENQNEESIYTRMWYIYININPLTDYNIEYIYI